MKILFFDGYCNLCNGLVDWVVQHDRKGEIKFASLQGKKAGESLPQELVACANLETVVYLRDGILLERSTAILMLFGDIGGPWKAAHIFFVIPAFLRNFIYKFVAANRYRFFGRRDSCRLPTAEERARFLD